jgi:hypothetical protein
MIALGVKIAVLNYYFENVKTKAIKAIYIPKNKINSMDFDSITKLFGVN